MVSRWKLKPPSQSSSTCDLSFMDVGTIWFYKLSPEIPIQVNFQHVRNTARFLQKVRASDEAQWQKFFKKVPEEENLTHVSSKPSNSFVGQVAFVCDVVLPG